MNILFVMWISIGVGVWLGLMCGKHKMILNRNGFFNYYGSMILTFIAWPIALWNNR